ncbi:MAG TPA: SHOCT domain-containing protein [Agromyces sp.]|nr:SHOCT domain-containing protein [Agromyces sp.]
MPLRRMGRPGLIGMAARTAVVAGTATAVAGGVRGHQEAKANQAYEAQQYEAQQQQAQMDAAAANAVAQQQAAMGVAAQQAAAAPAAAAPAAGTDLVAELQKLAALHDQGILSDDEFAGAKAKLLG